MILLAALLVVTGCGEDDKVLPEQQQQFESFLSGSHQPRLVTEQEAMSSDEDLDFYSTFGRWSYRYIFTIITIRNVRRVLKRRSAMRWILFSGSICSRIGQSLRVRCRSTPMTESGPKNPQEQGLDTKY